MKSRWRSIVQEIFQVLGMTDSTLLKVTLPESNRVRNASEADVTVITSECRNPKHGARVHSKASAEMTQKHSDGGSKGHQRL